MDIATIRPKWPKGRFGEKDNLSREQLCPVRGYLNAHFPTNCIDNQIGSIKNNKYIYKKKIKKLYNNILLKGKVWCSVNIYIIICAHRLVVL